MLQLRAAKKIFVFFCVLLLVHENKQSEDLTPPLPPPPQNQGQESFSFHTCVPGGSLATQQPRARTSDITLGPLDTGAGVPEVQPVSSVWKKQQEVPGLPGFSAWFPCSVSLTLASGPLAPQKLPAS